MPERSIVSAGMVWSVMGSGRLRQFLDRFWFSSLCGEFFSSYPRIEDQTLSDQLRARASRSAADAGGCKGPKWFHRGSLLAFLSRLAESADLKKC